MVSRNSFIEKLSVVDFGSTNWLILCSVDLGSRELFKPRTEINSL